jgi:DNA-binding NarL/FixJ family response regulator
MPVETGIGRGVVLVVDDSPETLSLLIDALEEAGLTALVARDGESAVALLDRVEPDVILLDAVMPGIDGFETCRRIKRRPEFATTPVVFMTGLSDRSHVSEALRAGGVDYLSKPVSPDELIARISVHVVNARMVADARRALDASGRGVAALSPSGALVWATDRASELLSPALADPDQATEIRMLAAAAARDAVRGGGEIALGDAGVRIGVIGRAASGDVLVRVWSAGAAPAAALSRELGVSEREGEVLAWIAQGKSNADIAQILGLSPRTVMKHVEQIFAKIGVENRTAAAAAAIRAMERS